MPRLSVVIAAYNAGLFISETIEAVFAQTFADFELIIIDDASTDDTLRKIQRFTDPRLRVIRNAVNLGVARTRNVGLQAARGEYLAANDHDDVSLPTRFAKQIAFLDRHPDVLALGTGIFTLRDGRRSPDRSPATCHHVIRWQLMTHSPICHSTLCVRLAQFRSAGLSYDPTCDFGDDFDLYHRMAASGRLANLAERLVVYRLHGNNASVLRESEMSARGAAMLARAHARYLDLQLDYATFGALWHVITFFSAARTHAELRSVGDALARLLQRYLDIGGLSEKERK